MPMFIDPLVAAVAMEANARAFLAIHNTLAPMQGYEPIDAHNGLSAECRANRHEDCVDVGCVCACHGAEDE